MSILGRARKSLMHFPRGLEFLDFVRHSAPALEHAAAEGVPPIVAIEPEIRRLFGEMLEDHSFRKAAGMAVRATLEPLGWRPAARAVRIKGSTFATGRTYCRKVQVAASVPTTDLLRSMLESLSSHQARQFLRLLIEIHPHVSDDESGQT